MQFSLSSLSQLASVSESDRRDRASLLFTISFTYNEPVAFYEYVYDIARAAEKKNLKILWHSNGSINPEPLKKLLKYTDAVTIDLKGFTEKFYREVSAAKLEPVLKTLKIIKEKGVWLELVNLYYSHI